jgi:uncharacterized protein (DUF849 family)
MRASEVVIVSCAITGSVHTPSMSPFLPITPAEIAEQAVNAAKAGAAILHLHARVPESGQPSGDPVEFMKFLPAIASGCDAVINITTGGSTRMTLPERLAAAKQFEPELASLNMGSMNFSFAGAAARVQNWKYSWEKDYVLGSDDVIFANTFTQIERTMKEVGDERGTRFEFECYDVGHLYNLAHMLDKGLVKPPLFIQCILGILGGIGATPSHFAHMLETADNLFGNDYFLSCFAAGRHQMPFAALSAVAGGHVRVGLEDSLFIGRGALAESNAAQVTKVVNILTELGRTPASPDQARTMLGLKGAETLRLR